MTKTLDTSFLHGRVQIAHTSFLRGRVQIAHTSFLHGRIEMLTCLLYYTNTVSLEQGISNKLSCFRNAWHIRILENTLYDPQRSFISELSSISSISVSDAIIISSSDPWSSSWIASCRAACNCFGRMSLIKGHQTQLLAYYGLGISGKTICEYFYVPHW